VLMTMVLAFIFGISGAIKLVAVAGLGCWAFLTLPDGTRARVKQLCKQRCELGAELAQHPPAVIAGMAGVWLFLGLCAAFKVAMIGTLVSWRRGVPGTSEGADRRSASWFARCQPQQRQHQQHQQAAAPVPRGAVLPPAPAGPGSFGPGVEQLQRFLIARNLMPADAIRWRAGVLGPRTAEALGRFRAAASLAPAAGASGIYDDAVRAAMLDLNRPLADLAGAEPAATPSPADLPAAQPDPASGQRWAAELAALEAMGFQPSAGVAQLLDRSHGSLDWVITQLVR